VLYVIAIYYVSSMPSPPPIPGGASDLQLHALAYFGLTLVLIRAVAQAKWARVTTAALVLSFAISVGYGASDEWHQSFVPKRHADVRDLAADAVGAAIAGIAVKAWSIIRRL
jgi:VanZ family protein